MSVELYVSVGGVVYYGQWSCMLVLVELYVGRVLIIVRQFSNMFKFMVHFKNILMIMLYL